MFDSVFNDEMLKEGAEIPKPKKQTICLLDDPIVYPSIYKEKLANIDIMSEEELYNTIAPSLSFILRNIMNGESDYEDLKYFTNQKFLHTATNVVARNNLPVNDIIAINTIVTQYLYSTGDKDTNITESMKELIRISNRRYIEELCYMTGVDTEYAIYLSMAFLSDTDGLKSILRANQLMIKLPDELSTQQKYICIYETFSELIRMRNLFKAIMFDYGAIVISDKKEEEKFSTLINAVLCMLNGQSYETIRFVLIEYYNEFIYTQRPIRFPIQSLAYDDYGRILQVVNNLMTMENIVIP